MLAGQSFPYIHRDSLPHEAMTTETPTARRSFTRNWQSRTQSRKRDLPGELTEAFRSASWIWAAGDPVLKAPAGLGTERAFRFTFSSPEGKVATSALILMTVDNQYAFYVNGIFVGNAVDWTTAEAYGVNLQPASNVFAVEGLNDFSEQDGGDGSAGVLAAIQILFSDGTTQLVTSDDKWRAVRDVPDGFSTTSFDESQWPNAVVIAKYGSGPWASKVTFKTDSVSRIASSATPFSASPVSITLLPSATSATSAPVTEPSALSPPGTSDGISSANKPIGAIVGGVIGGVAILFLIVAALLWFTRYDRRRKRRMNVAETLVPFEIGPSPPGYREYHESISQLEPSIANTAMRKSMLASSSSSGVSH